MTDKIKPEAMETSKKKILRKETSEGCDKIIMS